MKNFWDFISLISKLQGDVACNQGPRPTKLPDCMGYRDIQSLISSAYLRQFFSCLWRPAKPRTGKLFNFAINACFWRPAKPRTGLIIHLFTWTVCDLLESGCVYDRHFRMTFNLFAIFIEEIYFRSLFLI